MNDIPQESATAPQPNAYSQPEKSGLRRRFALIGVILLLIVGAGVAWLLMSSKAEQSKGTQGSSQAATALYDSLQKAAAQQRIRVAMLHKTYATKADLESGKDAGIIQSSVGEITPGKFRGLYAQKMYDTNQYRMQRCMDKAAYIDGLGAAETGRQAPTSLAEANEYLKNMYVVTQDLQFIVCPNAGVMPGAAVELAPIRMSDGLMPITLTDAQAANWKQKVAAANLFTVKDEGMVAHDGKQLRKYSFAPREGASNVNKQLYDIFYETAEIDRIKREIPEAKWEYSFIPINPAAQGGIRGFYLIDEASGLPVYSELKGINADRDKSRPVSRANIGFNKQTYAYPSGPELTLSTPLEFVD